MQNEWTVLNFHILLIETISLADTFYSFILKLYIIFRFTRFFTVSPGVCLLLAICNDGVFVVLLCILYFTFLETDFLKISV